MSAGFRVFGIPAPQGSKIPGVSSKTGKMFVREQSGKKLSDWRTDVKDAALAARLESPTLLGPVAVRFDFFMPRPASVSPKKRPYPSVRPDLDKLIRATCDALKQSGIYQDDQQVVSLLATKQYAREGIEGSPGAWIVVSEIVSLVDAMNQVLDKEHAGRVK